MMLWAKTQNSKKYFHLLLKQGENNTIIRCLKQNDKIQLYTGLEKSKNVTIQSFSNEKNVLMGLTIITKSLKLRVFKINEGRS